MNNEFKNGQTVYDRNGVTYEFHHQHGGRAFIRQLFVAQELDHHGEGVDYDALSDKFDVMSMDEIYSKPPVQVVDARIVSMTREIEEAGKELDNIRTQRYEMERGIREMAQEVGRFERDNPLFKEMKALLNGDDLWALSYGNNGLYHDQYPPNKFDLKDGFKLLSLRSDRSGNGKFIWTGKASSVNNGEDNVKLFFSEDERDQFVKDGFEKIVTVFLKSDNAHEKFASKYSSMITYEKLIRWVNRWEFLEMPVEVEQQKTKFENKAKDEKKRALQKQLEALQTLVE